MVTSSHILSPPRILAAVLVALFLSIPALATSKDEVLRPHRILQHSELAVFGEVVGKNAGWEGKMIYTTYDIRVLDVAMGQDENEEISIRVPGGEVEKPFPVGMRVAGFADLKPGEKIIAFLAKNDSGNTYHLAGSGVFPVQSSGGKKPTVAVPSGRHLPVDKMLERIQRLEKAASERRPTRQNRSESEDEGR